MKKNMTLPLIKRHKLITYPTILKRKLKRFAKRGLSLIGIQSSKPSSSNGLCSSCSCPYSDSLEIPDLEPLLQTLAGTSKRTLPQTHSSAMRLTFRVTRPSTLCAVLQSAGFSTRSREKLVTNISPAISGLDVQILYIPEERLKD